MRLTRRHRFMPITASGCAFPPSRMALRYRHRYSPRMVEQILPAVMLGCKTGHTTISYLFHTEASGLPLEAFPRKAKMSQNGDTTHRSLEPRGLFQGSWFGAQIWHKHRGSQNTRQLQSAIRFCTKGHGLPKTHHLPKT